MAPPACRRPPTQNIDDQTRGCTVFMALAKVLWTPWAFAKAIQADAEAQFFTALAGAAQQRLHDLNAQGIANTTWALPTTRLVDAQLFMVLARMTEKRFKKNSTRRSLPTPLGRLRSQAYWMRRSSRPWS